MFPVFMKGSEGYCLWATSSKLLMSSSDTSNLDLSYGPWNLEVDPLICPPVDWKSSLTGVLMEASIRISDGLANWSSNSSPWYRDMPTLYLSYKAIYSAVLSILIWYFLVSSFFFLSKILKRLQLVVDSFTFKVMFWLLWDIPRLSLTNFSRASDWFWILVLEDSRSLIY